MSKNDELKNETANGTEPVLADSYYWYCRFTFPNDKLECYLTERNNCKTFKELRRWWRKEKPALKLVSAVRQ